eukprot:CAMPEP_0114499124 /NCGR_PEP_ID=MMETSP0109-20121206/7246_1 /TAXON_ID=29199 /ORGANISM="Chlorarachnion reptans, Strain CCCM449" /LENGTH=774 /DNA_ID=CAMNT_0001676663 /DNA_START=613 /DNA_END=2937 /DNA_ORIENTATION=-
MASATNLPRHNERVEPLRNSSVPTILASSTSGLGRKNHVASKTESANHSNRKNENDVEITGNKISSNGNGSTTTKLSVNGDSLLRVSEAPVTVVKMNCGMCSTAITVSRKDKRVDKGSMYKHMLNSCTGVARDYQQFLTYLKAVKQKGVLYASDVKSADTNRLREYGYGQLYDGLTKLLDIANEKIEDKVKLTQGVKLLANLANPSARNNGKGNDIKSKIDSESQNFGCSQPNRGVPANQQQIRGLQLIQNVSGNPGPSVNSMIWNSSMKLPARMRGDDGRGNHEGRAPGPTQRRFPIRPGAGGAQPRSLDPNISHQKGNKRDREWSVSRGDNPAEHGMIKRRQMISQGFENRLCTQQNQIQSLSMESEPQAHKPQIHTHESFERKRMVLGWEVVYPEAGSIIPLEKFYDRSSQVSVRMLVEGHALDTLWLTWFREESKDLFARPHIPEDVLRAKTFSNVYRRLCGEGSDPRMQSWLSRRMKQGRFLAAVIILGPHQFQCNLRFDHDGQVTVPIGEVTPFVKLVRIFFARARGETNNQTNRDGVISHIQLDFSIQSAAFATTENRYSFVIEGAMDNFSRPVDSRRVGSLTGRAILQIDMGRPSDFDQDQNGRQSPRRQSSNHQNVSLIPESKQEIVNRNQHHTSSSRQLQWDASGTPTGMVIQPGPSPRALNNTTVRERRSTANGSVPVPSVPVILHMRPTNTLSPVIRGGNSIHPGSGIRDHKINDVMSHPSPQHHPQLSQSNPGTSMQQASRRHGMPSSHSLGEDMKIPSRK